MKEHDIFNSHEQISKIDAWIERADRITEFAGTMLITSMIILLIWQYLIR